MPYRQNNYNFVIDSSFQPFSMQEMLVPLTMYKDEYEKSEAAYDVLAQKADTFKYLEDRLRDNPDSKAAQLYKNYIDDFNKYADDFSKNGLNIGNRRALSNLKRRYQGEIGRVALADQALRKERDLRRAMLGKDSSMLYASDNLDIDDFLDDNTPNLYGISGNELYARGAAAGKAASSRVAASGEAGSTLGGYYRKWVERYGISDDSIDDFMNTQEVQQQVDDILSERGVTENFDSQSANYRRARQGVLNGIRDGIIYQEKVNPVRDPGVASVSEKLQQEKQWKTDYENGWRYNTEEGKWAYSPDLDMRRAKGGNKQTPEQKETNAFNKALYGMAKDKLTDSNGFNVSYTDKNGDYTNSHYSYAGGVSYLMGTYSPKSTDDILSENKKSKMRILTPAEWNSIPEGALESLQIITENIPNYEDKVVDIVQITDDHNNVHYLLAVKD